MAPKRRDAKPLGARVKTGHDLLNHHVDGVRRRLVRVLAAINAQAHRRVNGLPNPLDALAIICALSRTALLLSIPPD